MDGALRLENSILTQNNATLSGGALYLGSDSTTRLVGVSHCTFTRNSARYGGAVAVLSGTTVSLASSVVANNVAVDATGRLGDGGGLWVQVRACVHARVCMYAYARVHMCVRNTPITPPA